MSTAVSKFYGITDILAKDDFVDTGDTTSLEDGEKYARLLLANAAPAATTAITAAAPAVGARIEA